MLAALPATNTFSVKLTDTHDLSRSYTNGSITLNHRPQWTLLQPATNVTVLSGGSVQCVEYGSVYSFDPDSDSYKIKIHMPAIGLPAGLNVKVVN
jgi:hypothetical protein